MSQSESRRQRVLVWVLTFGLAVAGCGGDGGGSGPGTGETIEALLNRSWSTLSSGRYEEAKGLFEAVIERDAGRAEAYLGLGWCEAFLGQLSAAIRSYDDAEAKGHVPAEDVDAARAVAYRSMQDFVRALASAEAVLAGDPSYSFEEIDSVDYLDVHLVRAEAAFWLGDFGMCQESLEVIDPRNGLSETDGSTWIVDGESYGTYLEALLAELERANRLVTL